MQSDIEYPLCERLDQVRDLGDIEERGGHQQAEVGVPPAHERLERLHLIGAQVQLGLIEHDDPIGLTAARSAAVSASLAGLLWS